MVRHAVATGDEDGGNARVGAIHAGATAKVESKVRGANCKYKAKLHNKKETTGQIMVMLSRGKYPNLELTEIGMSQNEWLTTQRNNDLNQMSSASKVSNRPIQPSVHPFSFSKQQNWALFLQDMF